LSEQSDADTDLDNESPSIIPATGHHVRRTAT
jgi:hypothetical protein